MSLSIAAIAGPTPTVPPRAGTVTGDFALSLAQVANAPVAGKDGDPPGKDARPGDDGDTRQDDAADGNALPLATVAPSDPSLLAAWLPSMPMPVATTPVAVASDGTAAAVSSSLPAQAAAFTTPTLSPPALPTDGVAAAAMPSVAAAPTLPSVTIPDPASVGSATAVPPPIAPSPSIAPAAPVIQPNAPPVPIPLPTTASAVVALAAPVSLGGVTITAVQAPTPADPPAPTPDQAPTVSAPQIDARAAPVVALSPAQAPVPLQPGATATTSAIQAFGSAMRAGLAKDAAVDPAPGPALAATHTAATPAVAATGDAQQAPLDLRRENWPHAMIDRIEALRDAADATSTRIRVVPDALGPIAMSVRKDGDTLHVHFTADQAQTRSLLTDAQPRLAAIAEQRGLRLGGSSVDAGTAGSGQQPQRRANAPTPVAPPSTTVAADTADDDDTRIA